MSALRGLLTSSTGLVAALKDVAAPAPATGSGAAPKQDEAAAAAAAASNWTQTTEGLRCTSSFVTVCLAWKMATTGTRAWLPKKSLKTIFLSPVLFRVEGAASSTHRRGYISSLSRQAPCIPQVHQAASFARAPRQVGGRAGRGGRDHRGAPPAGRAQRAAARREGHRAPAAARRRPAQCRAHRLRWAPACSLASLEHTVNQGRAGPPSAMPCTGRHSCSGDLLGSA